MTPDLADAVVEAGCILAEGLVSHGAKELINEAFVVLQTLRQAIDVDGFAQQPIAALPTEQLVGLCTRRSTQVSTPSLLTLMNHCVLASRAMIFRNSPLP